MSNNLAVINFSVGGTLSITGKTTLSDTIKSSSTGEFQGINTITLAVSGSSTFNGSLLTSTQTPTSNSQLTTKIYVDTANGVLNTRITDTDAAQRIYVDGSYNTLYTRITDTDASQRVYIDASYTTLNTRIRNTDANQRVYIDASYTTLNTRITDTDANERVYIDSLNLKPIFYVNQLETNSQTIANNTMTKVLYPSSQYNVFNRYSNSEYLFRPTSYPGYYNLNTTVCLPNITSGYIAIFKNGVEYSRGTSFSSTTTSANTTLTVSTLMYFSGSAVGNLATEADVRVICSPSVVVSGGPSKTFFAGNFIQP